MKIPLNFILAVILKIIVVLAFVYFTNQGFVARLDYLYEYNNYSTIVVFSLLWLFSILVLLLVSFQQRWWIRIFWALIISITTAASYGFYAAGGSELEVLDILELWQARHETGRAFEHFQHALIKAVIVASLGLLVIAFPPPKITGKARSLLDFTWWLPLLPIALFTTLIFIKSDRAVAGLPQQFTPASMASAIAYKLAVHEIPVRASVTVVPTKPAKIKHLLYLVDESINPDYLYSSEGKMLAGFSQHRDKIANFGIAISGSNCSARSNAILRLGASRDNLIETVKTSPSIWQYAKKAGFRTVYIDSQASANVTTKPNDFQNYMTQAEAKFIDKFYKVKHVPTPQLDYRLLELIKAELASGTPTFIYANKNGAHFPYSANYPESEAIYQPVFDTSTGKGLGSLLDLYSSGGGLKAVINTYKNSIRWTVDKFFVRFFNEIDLHDTAVIYTSDHGQYFKLNNTTHCTSGEGAPAAEGLVPLMLMTGNSELLKQFKTAAQMNYNHSDHFALFSTVLDLFGYTKSVQQRYEENLFAKAAERNAAFNTGDILGIISTDTIWREVSTSEKLQNTPNFPLSSE